MLTGRDTSIQNATSYNENVDAVLRHALDISRCGCSLTLCPGQCGVPIHWLLLNIWGNAYQRIPGTITRLHI